MDNQNQNPQPVPNGQPPLRPDGISAAPTNVPTTPPPAGPVPQPAPAPVQPAPVQPTSTPVVAPQPAAAPVQQPAPQAQTQPQPHAFNQSPAKSDDDEPSAISNLASGFTSILAAVFSWVVFPILVVLILHNFVFQAYHVLGTSMVSTLHNADYLIVSKVGYTQALIGRVLNHNSVYIPKRGEIIVFRYPKDPTEVFVKRVIATPGERVTVKDGVVTVYNKENPNGFDPDKGYELDSTASLGNVDEVVQTGNVFVMGDNRTPGGSYDSREWGELPSSYIIGNAVLRLLPLDQVKIL